MQADPLHTRQVGDSLHQLGQGRPAIQIKSVVGQVLCDELKLFHPFGRQLTHLLHDLLHRTRLVGPCNDRDGAIRTGTVTSLANLHKSIMLRGGQHPISRQVLIIGFT